MNSFFFNRAWQLGLEQSRVNRVQMPNQYPQIPEHFVEALNYSITNDFIVFFCFKISKSLTFYFIKDPNNGYPMYYRGNYSGQYPSRIVHTSQGPITVVYINDPYYYRRGGYRGNNFAYGALAGTALASTLFWPFWIPFFLVLKILIILNDKLNVFLNLKLSQSLNQKQYFFHKSLNNVVKTVIYFKNLN